MERSLRAKLPGGRFENTDSAHRHIMQAVRGKGNRTTEMRLRASLAASGIAGWRLNARDIKGAPDFYFQHERLAVFVDGCFWHGCLTCGHIPKKRSGFWQAKIQRNRERDVETTNALRNQGIAVVRLWEHELSKQLRLCTHKLRKRLTKRRQELRPK